MVQMTQVGVPMFIVGRRLWAALLIAGLLWPFAALAEHSAAPSSSTAHVERLGGGDWQAKFKVELWSDRLNTSSTWVLVIDQQGCQIAPLNPESQGAILSLPPIDGVLWDPSHASVAFSTTTE